MFRPWVIVGVTTAAIVASATSAGDKKTESAGDKKSDAIKIETKEFEKALEEWYGLKCKSHSLVDVTKEIEGKKEKEKAMKLLLEVAKDYDPKEIADLRTIFMGARAFDAKNEVSGIDFHCYDAESVRIARHIPKCKIEGEIKKGEVVRVILPLPSDDVLSKTATLKVELVVSPDK
jgi:hypothetical protein